MSTGYGWEGLSQVCATLLGERHVPERLCGGLVYLGHYNKCSPLPSSFFTFRWTHDPSRVCFNGHFPGKHGLASCLPNTQSSVMLIQSALTGQAQYPSFLSRLVGLPPIYINCHSNGFIAECFRVHMHFLWLIQQHQCTESTNLKLLSEKSIENIQTFPAP